MRKKIIIGVVVIVLSIVGIVAAILLIRQNQDIRKKAAPATNLTLVPTTPSPKVDSIFSVNVNVDTNGNQVVAAELKISFDAQKLELTQVTPGTFFLQPNKIGPIIDNINGNLSYTLLLAPSSQPQQGQGNLMVLTFKAKTTGNANIHVLPESLVGATGENAQNVLLGTPLLTLTIISDSASTSPTASPTPTASPSPTPRNTIINANSGDNPPIPVSGSNWPTILALLLASGFIAISIVLFI